MKKLLIAMSALCLAVATQAATVQWQSAKFYTAKDANGGFSTTGIKTQATAYLFTLTSTEYSNFLSDYTANGNMKSVWDAYKGKLNATDATATGTSSSLNKVTLTSTADVGTDVYGAIIYTYTDSTLGKDFYIANIASDTVGAEGGISLGNLGTHYLGKTAGTAIGGWQVEGTSPVPEPTSAMLLMLGLCGLALKRKQA